MDRQRIQILDVPAILPESIVGLTRGKIFRAHTQRELVSVEFSVKNVNWYSLLQTLPLPNKPPAEIHVLIIPTTFPMRLHSTCVA
jgi:hypothetical protein